MLRNPKCPKIDKYHLKIVVYDDNSESSNELNPKDSFAYILLQKLVKNFNSVFLLTGGFKNFFTKYQKLCESTNIETNFLSLNFSSNINNNANNILYNSSKNLSLNEFRLNTDKFRFNSNQRRVSIIASSSLRDESTYFKSKDKSFSTKLEETAPFRTSIYAQTAARQFEVVFYGNDKITAGKVVEIKMPNTTSLDQKKNDPHKFNDKRFLITECSHSFGETSHRIATRCISDSSINKFVYELPLKQE